MSELTVLDLERETVELLPRREALTTKRGKNRHSFAFSANVALVSISQNADADADGKYAVAVAENKAAVLIVQDANSDAG